MYKYTYDQLKACAELVVETQMGSVSMLQRKVKLGYNTASAIMNKLERLGIVGKFSGAKPRPVLIKDVEELEELISPLDQ